MDTVVESFGQHGALSRHVPGYAPRDQQLSMAKAVDQALDGQGSLVVEAGTGTGKTFAYLVPALLSGKKTIISTGTKHLQDQLFHRDLPVVRDALGVGLTGSVLKGRANYLCLHRFENTLAEAVSYGGAGSRELGRIRAWSEITSWGDVSELKGVAEDSPVWHKITSNADNCLGADCEHFNQCYVVKARKKALDADILIVNHHLFFADMALKEEGFGDILPGAETFILDEAHQLPEVATSFFGQRLGSRQMQMLSRDIEMESLRDAADVPGLKQLALDLSKAVKDARLAFGTGIQRGNWDDMPTRNAVISALRDLQACLTEVAAALEDVADHTKGLESCWRRATSLAPALDSMIEPDVEDHIHWYETFSQSFSIHLTPLDIAPLFQEHMAGLASTWVFTSATLAVAGEFDHFSRTMGLKGPATLLVDSPFDYQNNALLYLPARLPEPNHPEFGAAVADICLDVVNASNGRAFLLFTSFAGLRTAAERLEGQVEFPLLVQGSAPKTELLERFRELGNAVLLGTSSFWEGVDVRGEALSCVLIDKLPFGSPGDPVLAARINALRKQGLNPFMNYQLPNAVITLKQGVGRLIRDINDSGVLVICDPRLRSKSYGRLFLNSLPPMPKSANADDVTEFFDRRKTSATDMA